jgi:hypothetical protein
LRFSSFAQRKARLAILAPCLVFSLRAKAGDAPLPDPQVLRQRAIASEEKQEKDRENYSCTVRQEDYEFNNDGSVKRKHATVRDRFFVNGWSVGHVLERDGKPLSGDDARKEQERIDKLVNKYSNAKRAEKAEEQMERRLDVFLKAQRFSNGHREQRNGRSIVVYDLAGDPNFHPQKLEERMMQALSGRIWVDEELGVLQELKLQTDRDLKLAGGLANLHKGFQLHVVQQRQPDGVWLQKLAEGSGDARALFSKHVFRFHEETDHCHLFSGNTQQKIQAPK